MSALTWLLGVFVLLLALEYTRAAGTSWTAVWVTAMVIWFLAGVGLAAVRLVQLATGKLGAGVPTKRPVGATTAPAPRREE